MINIISYKLTPQENTSSITVKYIVKPVMKALTSHTFTIYQIERFIGCLSVSLKLWLNICLRQGLKIININVISQFCVYIARMHIVVIIR